MYPNEVAVDPVTHTVYVANGDRVQLIDPLTHDSDLLLSIAEGHDLTSLYDWWKQNG